MIFNTEKALKYESVKNSISYYNFSAELIKFDDKFNKNSNNILSLKSNFKKVFGRNKDVKK